MRRLTICAVAVLMLTGCGGETAVDVRSERTELEFAVAGVTETVSAVLYVGDGYSLYIPEKGWEHQQESEGHITEDSWENRDDDDVKLRVLRYGVYPDASLMETKSRFARESGYVFEDLLGGDLGDPLTGVDEDGDKLGFMAAEGKEGAAYVVAWEYPEEAADFGVWLMQIANTFKVSG